MKTTKTIAKTVDQLKVGDVAKFGTGDFRAIVSIGEKWGHLYVEVDSGPCRVFLASSRKWRVAA
jgi:hypothetical protein